VLLSGPSPVSVAGQANRDIGHSRLEEFHLPYLGSSSVTVAL
jgi:hypothetical protein